MYTVLICGGRDFGTMRDERAFLYDYLDELERRPDFVIHGAAPGADTWAGKWAEERGIPVKPFPAQWKKFFNAAGPIRNKQMLVEGKPDLVVAFPGGNGTADMMQQAKEAGVPVIRAKFRRAPAKLRGLVKKGLPQPFGR